MAKIRLDQLLVNQGLVETRSKAQALIIAGGVYLKEVKLDKPGHMIAEDADVILRDKPHPWVSRGGMKLSKGLETFNYPTEGIIAADIGSSTGGFTDVLLTHKAAKVYAVDVGHWQLDWKLRNDERVVVMESTNARHLTQEQIPDAPDAVVCDASFIGLRLVLPAILTLAKPGAWLIALIKPQFEVGKEQVGKGGVVRDPALHEAVCADIQHWLAEELGWEVDGIVESPITGPAGNKEFLIGARKPGA
jgi:23S rRNA (cytidine1920-2'-O)/16S rRNA (cytidine1409-2'-O)-methyltransferase